MPSILSNTGENKDADSLLPATRPRAREGISERPGDRHVHLGPQHSVRVGAVLDGESDPQTHKVGCLSEPKAPSGRREASTGTAVPRLAYRPDSDLERRQALRRERPSP